MNKHLFARTRRLPVRPLPIAAAVALMLALPAQAQSFSQSGSNNTFPDNLLPYVGTPTSLDFGSNVMSIGSSGAGSFSALAGAVFTAAGMNLGDGLGNGTVFVTGAGSRAGLGAFSVANWGSGTLVVSAGGVVDATTLSSSCLSLASGCFNAIGNGAGSTGTMTITGANSEVRTLRNLSIGQAGVFTIAQNGFDFGTPGGVTTANVSVLNGAAFRTERVNVGTGPNLATNPGALGTEKANGTVVVSGAGSQWLMTRNSIDNRAAGLSIGSDVGGDGKVTLSNGGKLRIDGTGSPPGQVDFVNIGTNNGTGELTLTGAGSSLDMVGYSGVIQVGIGGTTGNGSFSILAGASVSAVFLNVGRNGASGTVLIDGTGSLLQLSGEGNYSSGGVGSAFVNVGWEGSGQMTVSNGAVVQITDGGTNNSPLNRGPGFIVGQSNGSVNGNGTLNITGAGSRVEISSTSISPAAGAPDNGNPYFSIGRDSGSTGNVSISEGGKLLMTGNALSTPTHGRTTYLAVGGNSDTLAGGIGTLSVTGAGSEVRLTGTDAFIVVGRNGTGTLNMSDGALAEAISLNVGRGASGNGTMTMDAATLQLSGQFTDSGGTGSSLSVGNRGGSGSLTMSNGSTASITNLGSAGASFNVGGTGTNPLGTGTLAMSGGSQITVTAGAGLASASIGRDGSGVATLQGSSQINVGDGTFHVGRFSSFTDPFGTVSVGTGAVNVESGSKILAGVVQIGGSSDTAAGGNGTVSIQGDGSELRATGPSGYVGVGRGSETAIFGGVPKTINGVGLLTVTDQAKLTATVLGVGLSGASGTLLVDGTNMVNGPSVTLSGEQTSGAQSGAGMAIGFGGGTGAAVFNNAQVSISNLGSKGAGVTLGGSVSYPAGSGTLTMANSDISVNAAAGLGDVSIGRSGTGVATLSNSTINNINGNVFVGREVGSAGVLTLTNGSVVNTGYFGVGVSAPYAAGVQSNGGSGVVVLNDSTINTGVFELGTNGTLTGNNGTIDAVGDVIIGGTISPGNSPGRMRIRCNIIMLPGSRIVLEISGTGNDFGAYEIDQLIIGDTASFDLASAEIVFSFLGDTNPKTVSALGGLDLDNFLRAGTEDPNAPINGPTQALSTLFAAGDTWGDVIEASKVSAISGDDRYKNIVLDFNPNTGMAQVISVPEPSTWGMMFVGLAAVGAFSRRHRAQMAAA